MNAEELLLLDGKRGRMARGEWLRCASLDKLPPVIPAVNREAWIALGRVGTNLNQIAHGINAGDIPDLAEIRAVLAELRATLLGIRP